jgi:hypothetical protein
MGNVVTAADVGEIVRRTLLAPHAPGPRPWTLEVTDRELSFRIHPVPDSPTGSDRRQAAIAVGVALFHLRVTARSVGLDPVVHLFPDVDDENQLALAWLDGCPDVAPNGVVGLAGAIDAPVIDPPVGLEATILDRARDAAVLEGAWLHLLGELVASPGLRNRPGPAVGVLGTDGDTALDWITAGQAFGRVRLEARAAGVDAWSSFGAVPGGGRRRPAVAVLGRRGTTQLLIEIGRPLDDPV